MDGRACFASILVLLPVSTVVGTSVHITPKTFAETEKEVTSSPFFAHLFMLIDCSTD